MMYKTSKCVKMLQVFSIIFPFITTIAYAQSYPLNKYGLFIVHDVKLLQSEIATDPNKRMVDLNIVIPRLVFDLRYTTIQNFMHRKLYPTLYTTYLRLPTALALKKVVDELNNQNLTIKIFDAYRPYTVTEEMWEPIKDSRYAADPATGSGHNRGIAVDLTLADLSTKKELPMGAGFDNFSDTAHSDFKDLPAAILQNRLLLKTTMEKYGFTELDTEWWHFSLPNANAFELLDVSFDDLKKLNQ
jgi:D-alanyl-D-alanine dipeptidase